ncbi:hypothetical protein GCM10022243_43940 [Saccharothrix violaceirubra]|uniref:Cytochrome P450 n=1 Tax=Saccharothrix violaceirubra TaxID=413306 RepID=A0A7W7T339_9PSEU|nr:cytochrome P450 [Saccharothrix violaceirubra]MBB4965683.1 cytochrome P450 [Saccharothrix violaceirubra]
MTFDPDRWLKDPTFDNVPFGWAPTTCLGVGIGIAQLILWFRLLTTRYRVTTNRPSRMTMLASPTPHDFRGTITSR